jgi:hypothetical protein
MTGSAQIRRVHQITSVPQERHGQDRRTLPR